MHSGRFYGLLKNIGIRTSITSDTTVDGSSSIMRRLAQFVRLRASRVCVCLASACICLACVSRLSASVHVKGSECVRLRLRLSRVCLASASVSRLRAFVSRASRVCLRLFTSRVPNACVCVCVCLASVSRRSSCLASVRLHLSCVCLASVVLYLSASICLASASVSRRSSCLASVCLLVNACGNWLILCVGRHSKGFLLS